MTARTPPDDGDDGLESRFASLFRRFAPSETAGQRREAAFLLDQLRAEPGARLLFCERSLPAYGWVAVAQGCSVSLLSDTGDVEIFDGSACAVEALLHHSPAFSHSLVARLSANLKPGARLVITGELSIDTTGLAPGGGVSFLGSTLSPEGRWMHVWIREPEIEAAPPSKP